MKASEISIERLAGDVDGNQFVALFIPGKGCCEVGLARETAQLRRLWVAPHFRRQGYGRALFEAAVKEALAAGKLSLTWSLRKDNDRARLFYGALGAVIVHDDGDGNYWVCVPLNQESEVAE